MSTADDRWTLNRERLRKSLAPWERTGPDDATRRLVNEGLMDLVSDPLHWGNEDEGQPDVFYGRAKGTNVGITYVVNLRARTVSVVVISEATD